MSNVLNALGLALLHSLWLQLAITIFFFALSRFFIISAKRYGVLYLGLLVMPVSFLVTSLWVYTPDVTDHFTDSIEHVWKSFALTLSEQNYPASTSHSLTWVLPLLVAAWFLGIAFFSLRLIAGGLFLRGIRQAAKPFNSALSTKLNTLLDRILFSQSVKLELSETISSPMILGVFRPIILIPVSLLSGLTLEQLELILLHELAHIRRYDPLLNALQSGIETLFFYHPALWFLSRQIRHERECACDDLVIKLSSEPLAYAKALSHLESLRIQKQLALAATGGKFMNRIQRIVKPQGNLAGQKLLAVSLLSCLLLAACSSQLLTSKDKTASLASFTSVCLTTHVVTGKYVMPAFNTASLRAMTQVLAASDLELLANCDDASVGLSYSMAFDARKLNWQAQLSATNPKGKVLWSGLRSDAIQEDGAFQYTTEHTAESLLKDFLSARAK